MGDTGLFGREVGMLFLCEECAKNEILESVSESLSVGFIGERNCDFCGKVIDCETEEYEVYRFRDAVNSAAKFLNITPDWRQSHILPDVIDAAVAATMCMGSAIVTSAEKVDHGIIRGTARFERSSENGAYRVGESRFEGNRPKFADEELNTLAEMGQIIGTSGGFRGAPNELAQMRIDKQFSNRLEELSMPSTIDDDFWSCMIEQKNIAHPFHYNNVFVSGDKGRVVKMENGESFKIKKIINATTAEIKWKKPWVKWFWKIKVPAWMMTKIYIQIRIEKHGNHS